MGVLDDAIRQHLDLKRQHGAPEEEVTRQETEALGPARREAAPEPAAHDEDAAGEFYDDADAVEETQLIEPGTDDGDELFAEPPLVEEAAPLVQEAAPSPGYAEELEAEEPVPAVEPEVLEEPHPSPPAKIEGDPLVPHEQPPPHEPPFREEPSAPAGDTPPRGHEPLDQPTEEHPPPPPPEGGPAPEGEGEDVLEGTPDFLEETPEHDRLWFEQKPPRDFDFDD
jgi:hypothetical protein